MKSLYFVGNEELWSEGWFATLLEGLKSRSMNVVLLDETKDFEELKNVVEKLSHFQRLVFHKSLSPDTIFEKLGMTLPSEKSSLIYVFSDIINDNAVPKQVFWGASLENFLKTMNMWEVSQVIEDAFLFEGNVAGEVSRAIGLDEKSLIDANLLTADADELESLLSSKTNINEVGTKVESIAEIKADIVSASPSLPMSVDDELDAFFSENKKDDEPLGFKDETQRKENLQILAEEPEFEKKTKVIQPVQVADAVLTVEASSPVGFSESIASPGVPSVEVSQLISAMSQSVSSEDMEVLKRYSSIKERELRESQAATEALRRQIRYFDERLKKSEEDRRNLVLKLEETENELRTVADKKDENRAQLKSIESRYEEKIKELLMQLESSQFQAGKLDKKLTDFKERVRTDLQKIRSRERELASRLEIQKRDAEALLSAKDERLLNQKREMDRLEFDLDALKERLLDDVQRGEERKKRVSRALQSLKLAQSILSGLDEDMFSKDDKDKAA